MPLNRRFRARWHAATAALSLALWLVLNVAEAYPTFHAWLHGGAIPDNDDCAIVALAHSKVQVTTDDEPFVVPVYGQALETLSVPVVFLPVAVSLPDNRGPPSVFTVS